MQYSSGFVMLFLPVCEEMYWPCKVPWKGLANEQSVVKSMHIDEVALQRTMVRDWVRLRRGVCSK